MAEPSYHGAPGAGQDPVRRSHEYIPHNAFTPPQIGHFAGPHMQIIVPMVYVPRIYIGSPAEIAGLLSAPALQCAGAYLHLRPSTPLDRAEVRVGEGRNVASRLHQSLDDWVDVGYSTTIIVVCDHSQFSKDHAETLEQRLTSRLESSGDIHVVRRQAPKVRSLSNAEHKAIDDLLTIMSQELARVGLNFLCLERPRVQPHQQPDTAQRLQPRDVVSDMLNRLDLTRPPRMPEPPRVTPQPVSFKPRPTPWAASRYVLHYAEMEGTLTKLGHDRFEIAAGTQVSTTEVPALLAKNRAIRKDLMVKGLIGRDRKRGDGLYVLRPIVVRSGAIAAAVVSGSTKSATRVWQPA